jgi:hypothetical protein
VLTDDDVRSCVRAGLRRLVIPAMLKLTPEAEQAAAELQEDGRRALELIRGEKVLDVLERVFAPQEGEGKGGEWLVEPGRPYGCWRCCESRWW